MANRTAYAHSLPDRPPAEWEPLTHHLERVATLAEQFGRAFDAGLWARQLGLWHDLGKFGPPFQERLLRENGFAAHLEERNSPGRVDHSTAGAKHAIDQFVTQPAGRAAGWLLAYAIAGHHTGLPDAVHLGERIQKPDITWAGAPAPLLCPLTLHPPQIEWNRTSRLNAAFQMAFFGRMLFSCLVDADFLATEEFLDPGRSAQRNAANVPLHDLAPLLARHLETLAASARPGLVTECRREILAHCLEAAKLPPGLFSLTVPTGGGKTLASLAFALRHAALHSEHAFQHVIYAIPFTSIIEQTAGVFRAVFKDAGEDAVLEHHSNLDPDERRTTPRSRLAAENWDAPIIVTTNVQFFESLFANRPARCRKLHRLVRSIIILDEVQTLPVDLLNPCLAVLWELARSYHATIVLCTATQPALDKRADFALGLEGIREIIPNKEQLYERMRRTQTNRLGTVTDADLVARLRTFPQFLCIVNTRQHAAQLYDLLRANFQDPHETGLFHLSTWMCGAHRSAVLATIRARLTNGLPCRVVSTSLIEAGVDVDFPVVFRALAGLDALAQAAGRCNREGRSALGTVYLFEPAEAGAGAFVQRAAVSAREVLAEFTDPLGLDALRRFFELHIWKHRGGWDAKDIMACFPDPGCQAFEYRTAAERFQFIQDDERSILVPWGDAGAALVEGLRSDSDLDWRVARKLQRYTVGVRHDAFEKMLGSDVELIREAEFGDRFPVLTNVSLYDPERGLTLA